MFNFKQRACQKYRTRMEDYLQWPQAAERDGELADHLRSCAECREMFAAAQLSRRFFADGEPQTREFPPSEPFVARVMAAIREQEKRVSAP